MARHRVSATRETGRQRDAFNVSLSVPLSQEDIKFIWNCIGFFFCDVIGCWIFDIDFMVPTRLDYGIFWRDCAKRYHSPIVSGPR